MKRFLLLILIFIISSIAYAGNDDLDKQLDSFYREAEKAIEEGNREKADFYLARYMGKTLFNQKTEKSVSDLYPLFEKHNLAPTSFISHKYDSDFLEWFIYSPYLKWKYDEAIWDEDKYIFELVAEDNGEYFVIILAYPYLEGWFVRQGENNTTATMALGDFVRKPQIVSGKLKDGAISKEFKRVDLDIGKHPLQYAWKPEFYDLDNDGVPEIWLRYNMTWGEWILSRVGNI